MSRILNKDAKNSTKVIYDFLIENDTYQPLKDRLTDQVLKNIDIKGFRKGKVPRAVAEKQVDPKALEDTIAREVISRTYPELHNQIHEDVKKDGGTILNLTTSLDPEYTKETADGFQYRVELRLLPNIDLSKVKSLKLKTPKPETVENRLSKDEFFTREHDNLLRIYNEYEETKTAVEGDSRVTIDLIEKLKDQDPKSNQDLVVTMSSNQFPPEFEKELLGLKPGDEKQFKLKLALQEQDEKEFDFEVKCKKVEKPKFKNVEELFDKSEKVTGEFKTLKDFKEALDRVYQNETDEIVAYHKRRLVIKEVIEAVPDFDMDEDRITPETDRIYNNLQAQAVQTQKSVLDVFKASGLPGSDKAKLKEDDIRDLIDDYVRKEFKLIDILQYIYYTIVEKKITEQDLDRLAEEMQRDPGKYSISKAEQNQGNYRDIANDRLIRSKSYQWLIDTIQFEGEEPKVKKSDAKVVADAKTKKTSAKTSTTSKKKATAKAKK